VTLTVALPQPVQVAAKIGGIWTDDGVEPPGGRDRCVNPEINLVYWRPGGGRVGYAIDSCG